MNCKLILPPNDIYKLPAIPSSYDELMREIHMRLSAAGKDTENLHLKYMDAENELVTLANQEDFLTAILSCEAEGLRNLKIHIFITESPKTKIRNLSLNCNGLVKINVKAKTDPNKKAQLGETTPVKSEDLLSTKETPKSTPRLSASADFGEMILNSQQIEAIKDFVGSKVMKAIEANMKNLMPDFIAKLKSQKEANQISDSVVRNLSRSFTQELNQSLNSSRNLLDFSNDEKQMLSSVVIKNNVSSLCIVCKEKSKIVRYVCPSCPDYKCCEVCEENVKHEHPLLKLKQTETNKISANVKGNLNMRLSLSNSPKNQLFITSGNKSFTMQNSSERKICYKGAAYLGNTQDQCLRLGPNESYSLSVNVKNIGKASWPENVRLSCVNGAYRGKEVNLKGLEPGEKKIVVLKLKTPKKAGRHLSQWRLYYEDLEAGKQKSFGESLFLEVVVDRDAIEEESKEENFKEREIMKMADYLNDIYPGDFEEKVNFVRKMGCVMEMDMCKVVEMYLQEHVRNLRGKKGSGCRPEHEKMAEKFGMSLML